MEDSFFFIAPYRQKQLLSTSQVTVIIKETEEPWNWGGWQLMSEPEQ